MNGKVMDLSKCDGVCRGACKHYQIGVECPPDATYEPVKAKPLTLADIKEWSRTNFVINRDQIEWLIAEVERLTQWDSMLCDRCHGVGEITVISGQTPENFSQDNVPCPDCVGMIIAERDNIKAEVERLKAQLFALQIERDYARHEGRMEALTAVFQINGPSRAIARLKEQYAAEAVQK